MGPEPPFDRLPALAAWAAGKGFAGVQVPTFAPAALDLDRAAASDTYSQEDGLLAVARASGRRPGPSRVLAGFGHARGSGSPDLGAATETCRDRWGLVPAARSHRSTAAASFTDVIPGEP
jgi:hypothetical protein